MDPVENLRRQRAIAIELLDAVHDSDVTEELAGELAELVEALDGWMSNGGFSPWAKP